MVNRTAEKVLSIISAVFTTIGIIMSFAIMAFYNFMKSDPTIREDFEAEMLSDLGAQSSGSRAVLQHF